MPEARNAPKLPLRRSTLAFAIKNIIERKVEALKACNCDLQMFNSEPRRE